MTTYTLTLELTKNENNNYIDANSVTIEVNEEIVENIIDVIKNMPEFATSTRIPLRGMINWSKDGEDTDDRIEYEELIIFKDGDLYVVGTEKYNSEEIESNSFRISEVDNILKEIQEKDELTNNDGIHYCEICCAETSFDSHGNCIDCGNPLSQEILDRDEEIRMIAYENKMMSEALKELGLTQEQISIICSGDLTVIKEK